MSKENLLIDRSLQFAGRMVQLHKYLVKTHKEGIISKQIIRSGTSIGANINEANYGSSPADFIAKMQIAQKETAETEYWIRLLKLSEYIDEKMFDSLLKDCMDIKNILTATLRTAKDNK
ncbi:MAG: four helix bundle protein [Firmicutes bacterium]|nr:four helix bundle protein [Bacillota bacterium]